MNRFGLVSRGALFPGKFSRSATPQRPPHSGPRDGSGTRPVVRLSYTTDAQDVVQVNTTTSW